MATARRRAEMENWLPTYFIVASRKLDDSKAVIRVLRIVACLGVIGLLLALSCAPRSTAVMAPGWVEPPTSTIAQRWKMGDQEIIARWELNQCWVVGRTGITDSAIALRYPDATCRDAAIPRWLDALDVRTTGANYPATYAYRPAEFLPPPAAIALAKRFLERDARLHPERFAGDDLRDARWSLELYSEDGRLDRERFASLCEAGNAVACVSQADASSWIENAEHACRLGLESACTDIAYRRYLAVREMARRSPAVSEYHRALCESCLGAPGTELSQICIRPEASLFDRVCANASRQRPAVAGELRPSDRPLVVAADDDQMAAAAKKLDELQHRALDEVRASSELTSLLSLLCEHGGPSGRLAWLTLGSNRAALLGDSKCRGERNLAR